jgi:hypothetical protein
MIKAGLLAGLLIGEASLLAAALVYWVYLCADKEWGFLAVISPVLVILWFLLTFAFYLE